MVVEIYVHVAISADSQAKLQNLNPTFVCDEELEYERAVQSWVEEGRCENTIRSGRGCRKNGEELKTDNVNVMIG